MNIENVGPCSVPSVHQGNTYEINIGLYDTIIVNLTDPDGLTTIVTEIRPRGVTMDIDFNGRREFTADWSINHKKDGNR